MCSKMPKAILIAIAFAVVLTCTGCGGSQPAGEEAPGAQPSASAPSTPPAASQGVAPRSSRAPAARARSAEPEARPAPPQPVTAVLAAGTLLKVRTTSTLSTKTNETGETFEASLAEAVVSEDGRTVFPKGTPVRGRVVQSDPGGRVKGVASIALTVTGISSGEETIRVSTDTLGRQAQTTKKKDAAKVGIGAGIGAAIGAIAGGGKGAAIGAAAGGGAGTGAVLATRGDAAVVPAETVLRFTLTAPVTVQLQP